MNWARIPTDNYPMAEHHPDCKLHVKEEFTRLEYDGGYCIVEPKEAESFIGSDKEHGIEYTVSTVMLTRDQFENLPEFDGF